MNYRDFGGTGIRVSELGLGCSKIGGTMSDGGKREALRVIAEAVDKGINFIDTADSYAQGRAEELLGEALRGKRDKVVIATKAGYAFSQTVSLASRIKPLLRPIIRMVPGMKQKLQRARASQRSQDFSPAYLEASIDRSLARLGTDYIDVFLLHSPPAGVIESGSYIETLERARERGKIRCYGVSCVEPAHARLALARKGVAAVQLKVNLLDSADTADIVSDAKSRGVAVIAREALASGILARPAAGLSASNFDMDEAEFMARRWQAECFSFLAQPQRTIAQAALQYVWAQAGVSVLIAGMRSVGHLRENLLALEATALGTAELERIRQLQSEILRRPGGNA